MKPSDFLTELSNDKLTQYKTAAAADASKADKEGDFKKGDKRFSGIVKATKKQFDNDAKKDVAEGSETAADIDKKIEFHKQGQAAAQYKGSMNKMHAAKIRELEAKKQVLKQGVAEGSESLDDLTAAYQHHVDLSRKYRKKGNREKDQHHTTQAFNIIQQIWEHPDYKLEFTDDPLSSQKNDALSMKHDSRFNEQGVAEGSTETPQQQQVRAAITKGMEKWDQNGLATYQSQPAKRNYFASSDWASGQLKGINSIDPDGTVVIELNDTTTAGLVKKLAALGGVPGVKTRQLKMMFDPAKTNADGVTRGDVAEDWSQKYKSSINCSHPKGFSQKAHCAGKKKHNESIEMEMVCEDCGMCETHTNHENLDEACWKGYHKEGNKKMFGKTYPNCVKNEGVAEADIIGFRRSADAISKQKVWQSSAASDSKQDDKTFSYQGYTINFTPDKLNIYLGGDLVLSRKGNFANPTKMQLVAARGNIGKIIDDKRRAALIRSVIQKNKGIQGVAEEKCPHCNGPMVSEEFINEKKDACYYKVKSRYKVWPSAYASGALVKCRNKGANNWGNGGKKNESSILEGIEQADESLHDWFNKEKWVRMDTKGNIKGPCAKEPGEGKPKCLPQAKAHSLGKKGRASAAARKRREDPNPDRSGKAINVNTKKTKG